MTTQTATDLRGICGNDRLKKCWKANETEQKRTQTNGKNHKKFQIPVGKTQAEVKEKLKKAIEEAGKLDIARAGQYTVGQ